MKTRTILLTGGTGTLGKFLIQDILRTSARLILLVRAETKDEANSRVKNIVNINDNLNRIKILKSDLTRSDFGLSKEELYSLNKEITHILHAAASTRFNLPIDEARRNNVQTTSNLLNFASSCEQLERFGFVSSAFVAGKRKGLIKEEELKHDEGFLNTYEKSKYEAETLVRTYNRKISLTIFRPSLIITPYKKSGHSPVNALTFGLFLTKKGFLPIIPGNEDDKVDIITGELVSRTIIKLLLKEQLSFLTYHITSSLNSPKLSELVSIVEGQLGKRLTIKFCGDMDSFSSKLKSLTHFRPDLALIYKKVQTFLPELAYPKTFDNKNLLQELELNTFSNKSINTIKELLK